MDADPKIGLPSLQLRHDLRKEDVLNPRRMRMKEGKQQGRRRQPARAERHLSRGLRSCASRGRQEQRPDSESQGRTARQHHVVVRQMKRSMKARLADVEGVAEQSLVELFDIEQFHLKPDTPPVNRLRQQTMKGEGVVRAGGDAQADGSAHKTSAMICRESLPAASSAAATCQPDRSRSPAVLEIPRTILRGTPRSRQANATANPSMSSAVAAG